MSYTNCRHLISFSSIQEKVEEHMMLGRDVDNVDTVVIAVKEIIRQHKAQVGSK